MDIYSKGDYPANVLSNFAPNEFVIDGVKCGGMEGFLQSLKFKNIKKQIKICALSGKQAKKKGHRKFIWKLTHNVWWQGVKIKRTSEDFSHLIKRAYMCLSKNDIFKKALIDTGSEELTHSIGSHNPNKTILTEEEFITNLLIIRDYLNKK